jgi:hypothetical protein
VLKSEKFHVGYPNVGSLRLLARANPKTSRRSVAGPEATD